MKWTDIILINDKNCVFVLVGCTLFAIIGISLIYYNVVSPLYVLPPVIWLKKQ